VISAPTNFRAVLATICTACVLGVVPGVAHADQYVVDHCTNLDTGGGGVAFGDVSGATSNDCGSPGGALRKQVVSGQVGNNQTAAMSLAVPADRPNIQIERLITDWEVPAATNTAFAFTPMFNGFGQEIFNGQPPMHATVDRTLPPGDRSVSWNVYCGGSTPTCNFASQYILSIYKTRLYLNESVAPTLDIPAGTPGSGSKSGQLSLSFDAHDADSGVASVTASLDATVVGSVKYACGIRDWSVCARDDPNQVLQVDTTKVPDGDHQLLITARDAANNALTRSLGTVTVANANAASGAPNGARASRLAKVTAAFTTTKKRSRRLGYRSAANVKGLLVNEKGQPIPGAAIAVRARFRRSGAPETQIATALTGADGRYTVKVPGGPSRTLRFVYTAFGGDPKPASAATLRTTVRASISARISPRSVRPGKRITLSGKLRLLPRSGIEIKIQARNAGRWSLVGDVKTTRTGAFSWPYRFKPSQAGRTFAFRARVESPIYPFATTNSRTLPVRVR
jgi:hypothetical protein